MVTPVACFSIDMILYNCIHLQTRITNNGFLSASLQSDPSSTSSSHSLLSVTLEPWPASPSLIVWCSTYLRTGSTASGGTRSCEAWAENWSRRTTSRWWGARNLNKSWWQPINNVPTLLCMDSSLEWWAGDYQSTMCLPCYVWIVVENDELVTTNQPWN